MFDRVAQEQEELVRLAPKATKAVNSQGRRYHEEPCPMRTAFQRDRDRIIHSKAFRRLKHKTQVFITPSGDHYRTRLTHTLEVAQIARTMARLLRLNEDLTEAIALGHDLGHTPFGHAGEVALNNLVQGGFRHNQQSLRVVDLLEDYGRPGWGLNLTREVRDGILCHTGEQLPMTLEGQLVRWADRIAYINHDIDDALRANVITEAELPKDLLEILGYDYSARISRMIREIVTASEGQDAIVMGKTMGEAMDELRNFLFQRVYIGSSAKKEETKVGSLITELFHFYLNHPQELPAHLDPEAPLDRRICDYLAGMTDSYCLADFQKRFMPKGWMVC